MSLMSYQILNLKCKLFYSILSKQLKIVFNLKKIKSKTKYYLRNILCIKMIRISVKNH